MKKIVLLFFWVGGAATVWDAQAAQVPAASSAGTAAAPASASASSSAAAAASSSADGKDSKLSVVTSTKDAGIANKYRLKLFSFFKKTMMKRFLNAWVNMHKAVAAFALNGHEEAYIAAIKEAVAEIKKKQNTIDRFSKKDIEKCESVIEKAAKEAFQAVQNFKIQMTTVSKEVLRQRDSWIMSRIDEDKKDVKEFEPFEDAFNKLHEEAGWANDTSSSSGTDDGEPEQAT